MTTASDRKQIQFPPEFTREDMLDSVTYSLCELTGFDGDCMYMDKQSNPIRCGNNKECPFKKTIILEN